MGEVRFVKVGQLKEGNFLVIDGAVCKIKSIEKSKPGKHGSAKARIVGFGVFDGQKRNFLRPTSAEAEVPVLEKRVGTVVAVMGDIVQVMDKETYQTYDVARRSDTPKVAGGDEVDFVKYDEQVLITRKR